MSFSVVCLQVSAQNLMLQGAQRTLTSCSASFPKKAPLATWTLTSEPDHFNGFLPCAGVGQELLKTPLDGPPGHWQPDSPDVQNLTQLAFFLNQGMNRTSDCIACKPMLVDMPINLRAPTLNEWTLDERYLQPRAWARPNIGERGSMQLVAMQVALTNVGTIDAVSGSFEVWLSTTCLDFATVLLSTVPRPYSDSCCYLHRLPTTSTSTGMLVSRKSLSPPTPRAAHTFVMPRSSSAAMPCGCRA